MNQGYYNFVVGNAWGKENCQNVLGNFMMDETMNPYIARQNAMFQRKILRLSMRNI